MSITEMKIRSMANYPYLNHIWLILPGCPETYSLDLNFLWSWFLIPQLVLNFFCPQ